MIEELNRYFDIRELVCKETYAKYGATAWQFFRPQLLETMLVLRRDILKTAMTVNNWSVGGSFSQRGLRCNLCQIVRDNSSKGLIYLSAHCEGAAIDFDTKIFTAEQLRGIIADHADLLPHPVRLEEHVNWCHIDVYDSGSGKKVTYFTI
ncbi:MAG: hypothetical protein WCJ95_09645 [Mariniphaga sp.]